MRKSITVLALLTVTACGGGGGKSYSTAQDMAGALGCADYQADTGQKELYVMDDGDCTLNGHTVNLKVFGSNESRDNWIKVASGFGIGRYVVLNKGVVTSDDQAAADDVEKKIGGEIRTS